MSMDCSQRQRSLIICPALAVFSALLLVSSLAFGQPSTGSIRLELKDTSGGAIETMGKLTRSNGSGIIFQTDIQGRYFFHQLEPGSYRLELSKSGFQAESISIEVAAGATVERNITMRLGGGAPTEVNVTAATPLPGDDRSLLEIPAPVQVATQRDLERSGALDLSDFLNRRMNSVYLNEVQGNPFQPDLNYRGYTASPLLGTPQGMSIYMDGVRMNQPFGDVVSWDLIPRIVIAEIALMPGSNPLFGLNTLGGAISVRTHDGRSRPGTTLQLNGGSFGRRQADLQHGGSNSKGLSWYTASTLFFEAGWRTNSPSNVRQFFGQIALDRSRTTVSLSVAYANNSLNGNGLQDQRLLARDYSSVYTMPDITANRSPFLTFSLRHSLANNLTFSGNAYYRYIRTRTFNGDINDESLDEAVYQPSASERSALTAAGYSGFPLSGASSANTPFPSWRCIAQALLQDEPAEKCNGLINLSRTEQHNGGASGQFSYVIQSGDVRNQLTAGMAFDRSALGFQQSTELGFLNPDRSITGVGAFGDGVSGGDADGVPYDVRVDLHGRTQTSSLYATDTFSPSKLVNVTASARYNRTSLNNDDRILLIGIGSLTSRNVFSRLNPAIGATFNLRAELNAYFGYSEGSRTPTSIELGCADPEQPCKLPNAMAGDPPLDQVVTRSWDFGVRGNPEGRWRWSAGGFWSDNQDDILFVASQQTGFGYFRNFGRTRRQGFEASINGQFGRFFFGGGYTFLRATFQSVEALNGESNSSNDESLEGQKGLEGSIQVQAGDRIPLVPDHMGKAFATLQATANWDINVGFTAFSGSFARGNENNLHAPDGVYYLGPGKSPAYAIVNLGSTYRLTRRASLVLQINNLLNRKYHSAAQLGPSGFTDQGSFNARPFAPLEDEFPLQHSTFFSPGTPIAVMGGIRISF